MSPNTAHPASPPQQDAQDYTTYQDCLEALKQKHSLGEFAGPADGC